MKLAYMGALNSPDPATQNGALLIDLDDNPLLETLACNEFPPGVHYLDERWERPLKYSIVEHAERGSIYKAARLGIPTHGTTMVSPWAACADCARAIILAGVRRLITHVTDVDSTNERWDESIRVAMTLLYEANVEVLHITANIGALPIRRNGKMHYG